MSLELAHAKLVLKSSARGARVFGGVMIVLGIGVLVLLISAAGMGIWWHVFIAVWGIGLLGVSTAVVLMPDTTTEFDLTTRNAFIRRRLWSGTSAQVTAIPFSEIASLTWRKNTSDEGAESYSLELRQRDEKTVVLSSVDVKAPQADLTEMIQSAIR